MKKKIAFRLATLLSAAATIIVTTTASIWYINQPAVPSELLEKK